MGGKNKNPVCLHGHPDCFAYFEGRCSVLESTTFRKKHDCPFYLSRDEAREKRRQAALRLLRVGRQDLLNKYEKVD